MAAAVSGRVFDDMGTLDYAFSGPDVGVSGVTVRAHAPGSETYQTTTSDGSGQFTLNLATGVWIIELVRPLNRIVACPSAHEQRYRVQVGSTPIGGLTFPLWHGTVASRATVDDAVVLFDDNFNSLPSTLNLWRENFWWMSPTRGHRDLAGGSAGVWYANSAENLAGYGILSAVSCNDGKLIITANNMPAGAVAGVEASMAAQGVSGSAPRHYSGTVETKALFRYGYIQFDEVLAASFNGAFAAAWVFGGLGQGDPKAGMEMDVVETIGGVTTSSTTTTHYRDDANRIVRPSISEPGPSGINVSHTWGVDWQRDWLRFYCDGVMYHELTGEDASWMHTSARVRIGLGVDADWLPVHAATDLGGAKTLEVARVRVWDRKP